MTRLAVAWILLLLVIAACSPPAPPPASVTVRDVVGADGPRMNRIRVDGIIDAGEWARADSVEVLLPDGREVTVLRQRGPDSLDFAFLGLGGNYTRNIYPEILLDASGTFPAQFSRDTWWFRVTPAPCVKRATVEGDCDLQLSGFERSPPPTDRRDNLEVRISITLLEFNPDSTGEIAMAFRFAEQPLLVDAIWPLEAELRRPDTWARVDVAR
jgi:hypothetical protein